MQFWKSAMDRFAKGRSAGHSGVWWKGSYLQIQTAEKLSEKVLWDVCILLRDLYLFSHKAVSEHCSCKTENVIFCAHWKLWGKVKYPEIKPRKRYSTKLHSDVCIHFRELKFTVLCPIWKLCLCGICEGILSGSPELVVTKETSSNENCREVFRATALWRV